MDRSRADLFKTAILILATTGLCVGLVLSLFDQPGIARAFWIAGTAPALLALLVEILRDLRRGEIGLDIVAALSMTAALAFGETLAATVVAVMYSGGTLLESFAEGRARHEMRALLSRVPRSATRLRDGALQDIPLDKIAPGDLLLIRQGDTVPVDGTLASATAMLDTSALTGESLPARLACGAEVMSGATNAGDAFEMLATRIAQDSTYAGIVRLVEAAQRSKAPMSRLADRWSLGFLVITLVIAGLAWVLTGDPIRAVAVLVVATPCPLILAVPVALVAGLSRASQMGVLIKGARPLEAMAHVHTLILDKTGTLTEGRPQLSEIRSEGLPEEEILRLAAALDQASHHPVAQAVVAAAQARGLSLPLPTGVTERPGEGVTGQVEGRQVIVGGLGFVTTRVSGGAGNQAPGTSGELLVAVGIDGALAGQLLLRDGLREGTAEVLAALRQQGVRRLVLATGDREDIALQVTAGLGLDGLHAGLTPDRKVALVQAERARGPVMMLGDGVNDAPALAAADVGVAMGARGAAASAEAADVVLLVDRIAPLAPGVAIARAARRIALESVIAGIGLSVMGMVAAAFGHLTPVQGALLQEAIDVAVILNALRALRITPPPISPVA